MATQKETIEFKKLSVNDNVHFLNLASSGYDIIIN
jgi:hypothetical protein